MPADTKCHHFIRHAVTNDERAQVREALKYARKVGDNVGIMLALSQLSPCGSK